MYEWLVRPAESELAAGQIDTLVFVLDLALQNLPLSALYDGEGYLIERYANAQNTGLKVIDRPQTEVAFHPLLGALSENPNVENFVPLEFADEEVMAIQNLLGDASVLMDRKFTKENFQNELVAQDYNVIHLATHGQFSSDPRQTFLLTAPTEEEPSEEPKLAANVIYVNELDKVLQTRFQATRQDIDLLVLSACETAKVDNRATLGLAGVAQRAGASSTLASLWSLYDESAAEFMPMFYQKLVEQKVSKAEALRLTQLEFLQNPEYRNRYAHPVFWASYVLVGNWL
jgi:CHAT domain-containing protein